MVVWLYIIIRRIKAKTHGYLLELKLLKKTRIKGKYAHALNLKDRHISSIILKRFNLKINLVCGVLHFNINIFALKKKLLVTQIYIIMRNCKIINIYLAKKIFKQLEKELIFSKY